MRKRSYRRRGRYRYSRRRGRGKYRQQLLSVATVKKIAKKVASKIPEVKRVENYQGTVSIGNPSSQRVLIRCLADSSSIRPGDETDERIGNKIHIVGFRIKAKVTAPILPMPWVELHMKVVKFNGPIPPTITETNTPNTWMTFASDVNTDTNKQKFAKVLWRHKVAFNYKGREDYRLNPATGEWLPIAPQNQFELRLPNVRRINRYIKVDATQRYVGNLIQAQQFASNYYLLIWAYADRQTVNNNDYWNAGYNFDNGTQFNPSITFRVQTMYRDP